jgi:hypothetical protein
MNITLQSLQYVVVDKCPLVQLVKHWIAEQLSEYQETDFHSATFLLT